MTEVITIRVPREMKRRVEAFAKPNVNAWLRKQIEAGLPRAVDWAAHFDELQAREMKGKRYNYAAADEILKRDRQR